MAANMGKPLAVGLLGLLAALIEVAPAFGQGATLPAAPVPVLPEIPTPPSGARTPGLTTQGPTTLGAPQPIAIQAGPTTTAPLTPPPPPPPPPGTFAPPPPPLTPPPQHAPPLYQPHDPGPNGWGPYGGPSPDPTFEVNAELQILAPALKNRLTNTVNLPDGSTVTVFPPGANLRVTVSPEIEFGYRLPESLGQFTIGYRFLGSDGTTNVRDDLGSSVKTRLNVNVLDFDYSTARYEVVPRWDMKWWLGVRYATNYFDNHLTNPFMDQRTTNYFNGAGPHAALEVQRHIDPLPAFAVFAKVDGAVMIGPLRQRFTQSQFDAFGNPETGELDQRVTQSVPMITIRTGLSYSPPRMENLRLSAGYQFEQWWFLGQLGDSRGELHSNGGFLRMELDF
jgi:hypothetical protein